jgi:hypothetical protein
VKIASYWQGELYGVWFRYKQPPDPMSRMELRESLGVRFKWVVTYQTGNKILKRDVTIRFKSLPLGLATYNYTDFINWKSGFSFLHKILRKIRTGGLYFIKNLIPSTQLLILITIVLF